ncbi:hypothetical protein BDW74DRAFT_130901 [Aspergillus multicolor]|uniref:uncharacterized protein n=1 Tax=Aspergillus multicolor TaxID=41759 RepID=UPI003CCE255D
MGLVMMQQGFVDFVTGPAYAVPGLRFEEIPEAQSSCARRIVRNSVGLHNFDMRAIVIVLTVGSAISALGLGIDAVVRFLQQRFRPTSESLVHWTLDGVFQLQRLAYLSVGVCSWHDEDTARPTLDGKALPPLDRESMAFAKSGSDEGVDGTKVLIAKQCYAVYFQC